LYNVIVENDAWARLLERGGIKKRVTLVVEQIRVQASAEVADTPSFLYTILTQKPTRTDRNSKTRTISPQSGTALSLVGTQTR